MARTKPFFRYALNNPIANPMSKILMVHSSTDGQTEKIINCLQQICEAHHTVKSVSIAHAHETNLMNFDKIVIGASVRYGKHRPLVHDFVKSKLDQLKTKQTFFFSVNVVARKAEKSTPSKNPYMQKFLADTSWCPTKKEVFAGKVDYPHYGFFDKNIIRFIMFLTKGPTDTSRCHEFTDWNKVIKFGELVSRIN